MNGKSNHTAYLSSRLLLGLCALLALAQPACGQTSTTPASPAASASQYKAKITDVEHGTFPLYRVHVSITDAQGNGIPDNLPVKLLIREDGETVFEKQLSEGLSIVMVLDVSGSMNGEKLQRAKEAAKAYMGLVPSTSRLALVKFADSARQVCPSAVARPPCDFSSDRAALSDRIDELTTEGETALRDGVGLALDLLRNRHDRKVVILLTDGRENTSDLYAGDAGHLSLLQRINGEKPEVFPIGLGSDVDAAFLRGLTANGGQYLHSPNAAALRKTFEQAVKILERERVFEFAARAKDLNGLRRNLDVELTVGDEIAGDQTRVVVPGVIPHVRGDHFPYVAGIALLLLAPGVFAFGRSVVDVYNFRASHVEHLRHGSPLLAKRDPNVEAGGRTFQPGDMVVVCPGCPATRPYHVRSWRRNRCGCMFEHKGKGEYCYHRRLPRWMRRLLDAASGGEVGDAGRSWLCRCAGDKEGY